MNASTRGLPRFFDFTVALLLILATAPLLAAVAALVAFTSSGPVLFRDRRIGKGGKSFELLKFRTMLVGGVGPRVTARTDPRITSVGRVLRRTKIDELPELWNVVRGDMALVGPRPESPAYVDLTSGFWQDVLRVRPGVTDPTTLRLRNEEELLATVGMEHELFYERVLVPFKLRGYRAYLSGRTWTSDLAVLVRTVIGIALPSTLPPPLVEDLLFSRETRNEPP